MKSIKKEKLSNMKSSMEKNHLLTIENIGNELKFERLYYNCLYPERKIILSNSGYNSINQTIVQELNKQYKEYYNEIPQEGFSYETIQNIETMNSKQKVYKMDIYYQKMFYLFKLYNFIKEDTDIFRIINSSNILPKDIIKEKIKTIKINYRKKIQNERIYQECINLDFICLELDFKDLHKFLTSSKLPETILCFEGYNALKNNISDKGKVKATFSFYIPQKEISNLTDLEKWIISLDIGKETSWLDDLIHNKVNYISVRTLIKLLEFLELEDTDLYYFSKQIENNKDYELRFLKNENIIQ